MMGIGNTNHKEAKLKAKEEEERIREERNNKLVNNIIK